MKSLKDVKRELLVDPAVRAEYEGLAAEFEMARELIAARARAGMTQSDVAQSMGTTQSVVARLESGARMPSLRTVQRYAAAVGGRAVVRIEEAPIPAVTRRRAAKSAWPQESKRQSQKCFILKKTNGSYLRPPLSVHYFNSSC